MVERAYLGFKAPKGEAKKGQKGWKDSANEWGPWLLALMGEADVGRVWIKAEMAMAVPWFEFWHSWAWVAQFMIATSLVEVFNKYGCDVVGLTGFGLCEWTS